MGFEGPITMKQPDEEFCIFEHYEFGAAEPRKIYLGRLVASGDRKAIGVYDLKKRHYINTTSMDSELALVTANLALARPGTLFYDPFMGTGSFPIACAHYGATTFGSDLDARSARGKKGRTIAGNFAQYGLSNKYLDGFISDLTLTPLRQRRYLDGIVCDMPYGVREGLKVLGRKDGLSPEPVIVDGKPAYLCVNLANSSVLFANAVFGQTRGICPTQASVQLRGNARRHPGLCSCYACGRWPPLHVDADCQ